MWLLTVGVLVSGQNVQDMAHLRGRAAEGNADAQYNLGARYAFGRGVPQDASEAVRWLRQAADQGHAKAQFDVGVLHTYGVGAPQDAGEAVRWYRHAANQGDAKAQLNLGAM